MAKNKTSYRAGKSHPNWGKSSAVKGKHWTLSKKTRINMREAQRAIKDRPWLRNRKGIKFPSNSDDLHPDWKGDDVGYSSLHKWVTKHLGRPLKCEHCRITGLRGRQYHWANKSHAYKRDLADWIRLCVPCHKKYDSALRDNLLTVEEKE